MDPELNNRVPSEQNVSTNPEILTPSPISTQPQPDMNSFSSQDTSAANPPVVTELPDYASNTTSQSDSVTGSPKTNKSLWLVLIIIGVVALIVAAAYIFLIRAHAPTEPYNPKSAVDNGGTPPVSRANKEGSNPKAKSEAQINIAKLKGNLMEYYADVSNGNFPKNVAVYKAWLGANKGSLDSDDVVKILGTTGYSYTPLPAGCDNQAKDCTSYLVTADKSIWGGDTDITGSF